MDSTFKVPVTKILNITNHPGADRLEIATIYGFQVIVPKGQYSVDEVVVYFPIDSILPNKVENLLFAPDAKVKLNKNRVRQIKLRGYVSQGMICKPQLLNLIVNLKRVKIETDIAEMLGVKKYEPPANNNTGLKQTPGSRKALAHSDFHKYNGLTNLKWAPQLFEGKEIIVQCKLHGTNARAAKLPFRANTLFKKIQKFLRLAPEFVNLYGSNNVDISNTKGYSGFYGEDVYGKAFDKVQAFSKIKLGETIFGEIIGPGIQKNYTYGLTEPTFVLFDVKVLKENGIQKWLNPEEVEQYAKDRGFEFVPVLYSGIYNLEMVYSLSKGPSVYCPTEPVREGCVVKDRFNYDNEGNKTALKVINEDYLANQDNSDNH